jgi:hypothetical protein
MADPDRWVGRDKRPIEEFVVQWDFVDDISAGDTVSALGGSGSAITAKRMDTGADDAGFLESPTLDGTKLRVQVQGGDDKVDYHVTFKAKTANGDVFSRVVGVRVRA